eukprot:TRINITY_DN165_c0_g1_i4.p1 TRINITY_DN165_c0_g1~~TRINITY_DN165_c0_g1_i4.p1  ORF type:complete len:128 (+),score=58.06 TRINITY_DN165_c0_g1_i4:137-520(+)
MIRRPPRSTQSRSSAASDVYKRQGINAEYGSTSVTMADAANEVNEFSAKKNHDYYMPRKCSVTNRLLGSKDHASVQINVGHVDKYGSYTGEYTVFCLSGATRRMGEGDFGLNYRCVEQKFMNPRVLK